MDVLKAIAELSPIGVIALLAYVVYLLVAQKGPVKKIAENHNGNPSIEGLLNQLVASSSRQEQTLSEIRDGLNYLKGRLNGRAA